MAVTMQEHNIPEQRVGKFMFLFFGEGHMFGVFMAVTHIKNVLIIMDLQETFFLALTFNSNKNSNIHLW